MRELVVSTFSEFEGALSNVHRSSLCRGVSNAAYELIPSLFRGRDVEDLATREKI